jgi:hypothetical protein
MNVDDLINGLRDAPPVTLNNLRQPKSLSKQIELLKSRKRQTQTENSNYESRLTKIEAMLNLGFRTNGEITIRLTILP